MKPVFVLMMTVWLVSLSHALIVPAYFRIRNKYTTDSRKTFSAVASTIRLDDSLGRKLDVSISQNDNRQFSLYVAVQNLFPSWMIRLSAKAFLNLESKYTLEEVEKNNHVKKSITSETSPATSSSNVHVDHSGTFHNHLRGQYVAGFMDFDPKQAARKVYLRNFSNNKSRNLNVASKDSLLSSYFD